MGQRSTKMPAKVHLRGSWALFGRGLGRSGPPYGHFWTIVGRCLGLLNRSFCKHWSEMASRRAFGSIVRRFGEGLGRVWMGLGRIWALKIEAFVSHGRPLSTLRAPCCLTFATGTPALPRYAPRSVTIRGGLRPLRVLDVVPQVPPRGFAERSSFRLGFAYPVEDGVPRLYRA